MRPAVLLGLALATPLAAQQNFDSVRIVVHPVAEGVPMLVGSGGNLGVSSGPGGVFVIDDQYAPLTDRSVAAIQVRAFHVPRAHTDGDVLIRFRRENVIHMGDTFVTGAYSFIDLSSGGNVSGVIAAAAGVTREWDDRLGGGFTPPEAFVEAVYLSLRAPR